MPEPNMADEMLAEIDNVTNLEQAKARLRVTGKKLRYFQKALEEAEQAIQRLSPIPTDKPIISDGEAW